MSGNDVGVVIEWYKNNQYVTKGPTTLSKLNLAVNDMWYCLINISDPYNKTYRSSNTITITTVASSVAQAPASGGGGGADVETPIAPKGFNPLEIKPIPVPVSQNNNPELVTNPPINQIKDAVLEQPKSILSKTIPINTYLFAAIAFITILTSVLIFHHPKNIPTNSLLQNFVDQSLYAGYSKNAIRTALKERYSASIINHHLIGEPNIRYKDPAPDSTIYNSSTIAQLKEYIRHQRLQGFKDADIKEALLHYGYSNKVLTEVYQYELA